MDIISRKEAISLSLNKYFTAEECKNGHISQRYVQSGTCEMCIRASMPQVSSSAMSPERIRIREERLEIERKNADIRERRLKLAEGKLALSAQRSTLRIREKRRKELAPFRVIIHHADVPFFKSVLFASAMTIDPTITEDDLLGNQPPQGNFLSFRTFQSEVIGMCNFANELSRERIARGEDESVNAIMEKMRIVYEQSMKDLNVSIGGPTNITA